MQKVNEINNDLIIKLIDETILLSNELGRLRRKLHSQYYDHLKKNFKLTNSIFVKEKRGRKAKIEPKDYFEQNEFEKDTTVFFD